MVNKPLIRPAISGGGTWPGGGRLTSHEIRPQTPNHELYCGESRLESGDRQGCTPIPTYPVMGNPVI